MSADALSLDRRACVGGAAGLMLAVLATRAKAQPGDLTEAEQANTDIVRRFCEAWSTLDLGRVTALMSAAAVYRMTETTPPVTGHEALIDQMQPWIETSSAIEFRILETFARGPLVVNHRIDTFSSDTRPLTWEGVGVFLIQNGKISEWSDYTISVARG
jgi:limonene-1,2-epoxide hydrolase